MTLNRMVALLMSGALIAGCSSPSTPSTAVKTYRSVWINAKWIGPATGPPLSTKADGPGSFNGRYCPAASLILENHSTRFQNVFSWAPTTLVFKNTCDMDITLLVCVTAGSVSTGSTFPTCDVDPRATPLARLTRISIGSVLNEFAGTSSDRSLAWADSGLTLDLNVFYCGLDDQFTSNVVQSRYPTDCVDTD
jgi:hypothetical protein